MSGDNIINSGTGGGYPVGYTPTGATPNSNVVTPNAQAQQREIEQLSQRVLELEGKLRDVGVDPTTGLRIPDMGGRSSVVGTTGVLGSLSNDEVTADMFAFMALFQQLAQSMRDTARTQRNTEMQSQVTAMQNAAEEMKSAAKDRFTAAMIQGSMQIAGGVIQVGASAVAMSKTAQGGALSAFGKGDSAMEAMGSRLTAQGQMWQGFGQGASGVTGGIGGMIGAEWTKRADMHDAERAQYDAQAKVHETAVGHASDMMQQMMDVIRDVRDKLQSIQQAAIETNRGIARNI